MNIGTIIRTPTCSRCGCSGRGGAPLGEIEEGFAATLTPGDTFLIGGQVVRYEGLREMTVEVTRRRGRKPRDRRLHGHQVRHLHPAFRSASCACSGRRAGPSCPPIPPTGWPCSARSRTCREADRLLVESFPHDGRAHTCVYGFAGRNAQQTLGLLLTQRMEELGLHPLGFVADRLRDADLGAGPGARPGAAVRAGRPARGRSRPGWPATR